MKGEKAADRKQASTPEKLELSYTQLQELIDATATRTTTEEERNILRAIVDHHATAIIELQKRSTSVKRLRGVLFGPKTEKARNILKPKENDGPSGAEERAKGEPLASSDGQEATGAVTESGEQAAKGGEEEATPATAGAVEAKAEPPEEKPLKEKPRGHGRNGARSYKGAVIKPVKHERLNPGDRCPECGPGKVYRQKEPALRVVLTGIPPIFATVYELERLRCNGCGAVFTAEEPLEAKGGAFTETAKAMLGMLRYGAGMPMTRLEKLEAMMLTPLPDATQWEQLDEGYDVVKPAVGALIEEAAQGEVLHNDDTRMKILEYTKTLADATDELESGVEESGKKEKERKGVYTTGIVSVRGGRRIALFFTGRHHAGENLAEVLKRREKTLVRPIQMCDGSKSNTAGDIDAELCNCIVHGRRKFVEIAEYFPEECRYLLEALGEVYGYEEETGEMSKEKRLEYHQQHSKPVMEGLHIWLQKQFEEKLVEPNSSLGEAITYMLNRWVEMTLFLRVAGAPLDNTLCERVLKMAILHRKNSLFYRTQHGAAVGDAYMSLIYTCSLNGVNPFDYLVALFKYSREVAEAPKSWLPWTYQASVKRLKESRRESPEAAA